MHASLCFQKKPVVPQVIHCLHEATPKVTIPPALINLSTSVESNGNPAVQDGEGSFAGSSVDLPSC